ncbi:MAG: hypothetical protein KGJ13_04955 [Patescibacteria group bacterium]|nr:hypothetical protein [Patescibacteria group bacterium]
MTPEENKIYIAGFQQGYSVATNDWINSIVGWLVEQDHPNIQEAMQEIIARVEHSGEPNFDEAGRPVVTPEIDGA